jgi:precorrin-2 methylase
LSEAGATVAVELHDAKRVCSLLVSPDPVARGERALESLDAAARFRDSRGLTRLRTVAASGTDDRARRAARVCVAFDRFRAAARGDAPDQFRPGRDTPLLSAGQPQGNDTGDPHR